MSQFSGMDIGMLAGGAGLSTIGGLLGAQSSNRAGRQARDWYNSRTQEGALRTGSTLFGSRFRRLYPDTASGYLSPQDQATAMDELTDSIGGPVVPQLQRLAGTVSERQTGNLRYYDDTSARLAQEEDRLASRDDAYGDRAFAEAKAAEDMAGARGAETERIIDRDAADRLKKLDSRSLYRLAASGVGGSTLAPQQMALNTRMVGEAADTAKVAARDATTGRVVQARQFSSGVAGGLYGSRRGRSDDRIGRLYGRAYGRDALENSNLERDVRLRQDPLNVTLSAQSSGVLNPWLGQGTSQYYPGVSGAGTAATNLGNAFAELGASGLYRRRKDAAA